MFSLCFGLGVFFSFYPVTGVSAVITKVPILPAVLSSQALKFDSKESILSQELHPHIENKAENTFCC